MVSVLGPSNRGARLRRFLLSQGFTSIYMLDERSGAIAYDAGNNKSLATITGATLGVAKNEKVGYSFDGINDEVSVSSAAFDYTTVADFTMMCLFNLTDALTTGTLMAVHTADAAIYAHFYHNSAELNWRVGKTGNTVQRRGTTTLSLLADKWYLATLTKVGNNDVKVYVGATENTSRSLDHAFDDGGQAAAATRLGVNRSAFTQTFGKYAMALGAFAPFATNPEQIMRAAALARV